MALNKRPTFGNRPKLSFITLVNADGTNFKDVLQAGPEGNKIVGIFASGEISAREIQLGISRAGSDCILATTNVLANAGRVAATPPQSLIPSAMKDFLPKDADQQPYIFLSSGDTLRVKSLVAVTAGQQMAIYVIHADFDEAA